MMTKKEYAESIMEDFAKTEYDGDVSKITEIDIVKSSSLAVAMEYLNLLKSEEAKRYASTRSGFIGYDLNIRDLLEESSNQLY